MHERSDASAAREPQSLFSIDNIVIAHLDDATAAIVLTGDDDHYQVIINDLVCSKRHAEVHRHALTHVIDADDLADTAAWCSAACPLAATYLPELAQVALLESS